MKRLLISFCSCCALVASATVFDFGGDFAEVGDGVFPKGWHFHGYPGFKPFPEVERVEGPVPGSHALHVKGVSGASGTAIELTPRIAAEVGDVIVMDMKVKGNGVVSASHFRQLENGGWNQGSVSVSRKLTADWSDFHSEIDVKDGTKGPTKFVTPIIGAKTGADFCVADVRVRRLRNRKPDVGATQPIRELASDTYDRQGLSRDGKPKIVREPFAPAIETLVNQGRYSVTKPVTISLRDSYVLPPERENFFRTSVRVYDFGGGRLLQTLKGVAGTLTAAVAPAEGGYRCVFKEKGTTLGRLDLPADCLPADFALSVDADGGFTYAVTTLAGSARKEFSGDTSVFGSDPSQPFAATLTLAPGADGKAATMTIDEHRAEIMRFAAKRPFPHPCEPEETFDPVKAKWPLVFADDFDGEKIDEKEWFVPPWRRKTAGLASLDGKGHLIIEARPDEKEPGMVESTGLWTKRAFLYGYFEARLKFTKLPCWWAAFWLYGMSNQNPFLDGLEIDIFEDNTTRSGKPEISDNMHVIHPAPKPALKSWSCHSMLPGTLEDTYVIGCKWTPFEISHYVNGRLMRATQRNRGRDSVTFDAFDTAACAVPLHVIFSGQASGRTKGVDLSQYPFPEKFEVDSIRVYAYPDADKGPRIRWTVDEGAKSVRPGEELRFSVAAEPNGAKVTAVYLFDNGYPLAFRTEPPYEFRIPFSKGYYETTRYMTPGLSGVKPPFDGYTHAFVAFARDEKGRISKTDPILRLPESVCTREAWAKDRRGFVRSGDAFNYDFDAPSAGRYSAGIRYVAGEDLPFDNRLVVLVDGAERTVLRLPYNTQPPKPIACEIELSAGKHRITFVPIGLFNVYGIEVGPRKQGE